MTDNNLNVEIALLKHQVKFLEDRVAQLDKELEGLRSRALMVSGGVAVVVIAGTVAGWFINVADKVFKTMKGIG